jgi:myosin heavy subunit
MARLEATDPYFVRCIKPNKTQTGGVFDHALVLGQLRYTGMVETIRIRALGYSLRMSFADFYARCVT